MPSTVASFMPGFVKRGLDARHTRRFLAVVAPATREYVGRYGLEVRHGPLAGLRYLDGFEETSGDLVAKLVGSYEEELAPVFTAWIGEAPAHVIDVGSAEGYYAVGLARAIPTTTMHAYDIDPRARELCAQMASRNDVADRVVIGGECTPATLADYPEEGVALLCDCEGYERVLLDPGAAPRLRGWSIAVELHEFLDPGITELIRERFAPSHEIEVIEGRVRDGSQFAELSFMSDEQRRTVLSENRPGAMRWMALRPRSR